MATRTVAVDQVTVMAIDRRLRQAMDGEPRPACEVALLWSYCAVALGVQAFPAATRQARAGLVVHRGALALCRIIEEVGALTDDQVGLEVSAAAAPCGRESCN